VLSKRSADLLTFLCKTLSLSQDQFVQYGKSLLEDWILKDFVDISNGHFHNLPQNTYFNLRTTEIRPFKEAS
jgi:hypothetical protein